MMSSRRNSSRLKEMLTRVGMAGEFSCRLELQKLPEFESHHATGHFDKNLNTIKQLGILIRI